MSSFFSRLNLRPQEQRIVVVVVTVVLVVLNALFIWPRFKDWAKLQTTLTKSRATLKSYQDEIARTPQYQEQLRKLEGGGGAVLPAEQALDLMRTVQNQAQQSSVAVTGTRPVTSATSNTNQFFDEQVVAIDVSCLDKELVDFLVALGSGDSMIRVRDMDLRPDPPQYRLLGKVTLVASYQKKPKPPAPAPTAKPAPAVVPVKPAAPVAPAASPATNSISTPKGKS